LGFFVQEKIVARADEKLRAEQIDQFESGDRHAVGVLARGDGVITGVTVETAGLRQPQPQRQNRQPFPHGQAPSHECVCVV
jgi:hypothetical protein